MIECQEESELKPAIERKRERNRSKNVKYRIATDEYFNNGTTFSRVREERIWLSRVKKVERKETCEQET
jgi:hypothetical protein